MGDSVDDLAALVNGEVLGDGTLCVDGFAGIAAAFSNQITFAAGPKYREAALRSGAGAIVIDEPLDRGDIAQIVVKDPNLAFAIIVAHLTAGSPAYSPGVDPRAFVHGDAQVDPSATIRPFAVVDATARIGARVVLHPHAYVGPGCVVNEGAIVYPGACLVRDVELGQGVIVQSGAVLGSDGFGYATTEKGEHVKVPQVGRVVVEDFCEIGANTCIDRARFDETRVGHGTKIDNLVQVAHNVHVGAHSLLVSQVGIAGSTRLGHHCVLGGHVGVSGHLNIGDGVQVGAFSGVGDHLASNQAYFGIPARPIREGKKVMMAQAKLPKLLSTVRQLEARIADLERRLKSEDPVG